MVRRIWETDWSKTPLGPSEGWSRRLRATVDMILASPHGMLVLWGSELVQIYNDGCRDIFGHRHPSALGQPAQECWPDLWRPAKRRYERVLAGELLSFRNHHLVLERNGKREDAWFDFSFTPLVEQRGEICGILVCVTDQTHRVLSERALRASERRLKIAMEGSGAGVFEYRIPLGPELYVSPRWCEILGLDEVPVPPEDFESWITSRIHVDDLARRQAVYEAFITDPSQHHEVEIRMEHAAGHWIWVRESAHAAERDRNGIVRHLSGMILDITQRKKAERQVKRLANHDPLTGLANRTLFTRELASATTRAEEVGRSVGLILLDVDRFKHINDRLGHPVGDALLRAVAERLANAIRRGDTAARIGGDEFAVVLPDLASRDQIEGLSCRLYHAIVQPADVDGHTMDVGISMGVAVFPEDSDDIDFLMRHADLALYKAKEHGQDRICHFHVSLAEAATRRARIEADLRLAIEREELVLHYQPQVSLGSGRIRCVEALVRWRRNGSLVLPGEFIPIAEASGVIRPLGAWVLAEACRQQARWRAQGHDIIVAVNVSPAEADAGDFSEVIDVALTRTGLTGTAIELEITEGLVMDPEVLPIRKFLTGCEARGIGLAIDDFGIGYSSLAYLGRLPIRKIKIDRSFVHMIGRADDETLLEAMVDLGRRLGKRVVAEGVENESQLEFLRSVGCDVVQGWLLSPPVEASEITGLLQRPIRA